MENISFIKNLNVFKRNIDNNLILLDNTIPSIFLFKKDVQILWDNIIGKMTLDDLYSSLCSQGYILTKEQLFDMVNNLIISGLLICDTIDADKEFIYANNKYNGYMKHCENTHQQSTVLLEITNNYIKAN